MNTITTVDVRDVEIGDRLAGLPGPDPVVASILLDCADGLWWVFGNATGRVIARRSVDSRVQIVRPADDCPPFGISRRFTLVPS